MPNLIRRLAAALATAGLILSLAHPALAANRYGAASDEPATMPLIFDAIVMRPVGLAATLVGTVFYAFPVLPIMSITRPTDIGKPFRPLVMAPARFTFVDPLGYHP